MVLAFFLVSTSQCLAQQSALAPVAEPGQATAPPANALLIEQLASSADVVAIAQVALTSYQYRRGFPVSGYAVLEVLIPYKTEEPIRRIRINEEGFGEDLCYFPPTVPGQEGARYLVFLARHEDGDYRGHPLACSLQVLVTDAHAYALRLPLPDSVALTSEQAEWIEPLSFSDPSAIAGSAELTPGRKQQLAEQVDGVVIDEGVKYTQGIPIRYFRDLIGKDNLKKPRRGGKY